MRVTCGIFLFFVLVIPLAMGALCMLAVNTWLFDRNFYQEALDDPALYEALLDGMPEYLKYEDYQRLDPENRDAANRALALAFREVVTPEYLRGETLSVIDDLFTLFETEDYNLQVDINLVPVKEALAGDQGADFARVLAAELPVCAAGQAQRGADDALISCRPASMTEEQAFQAIMLSLPRFNEEIPSQLVLNEPLDPNNVPTMGALALRAAYQLVMWGLVVFAALVWIVTAFIAASGQRQRLVWLGLTLLIPAFIILMLGISLTGDWLDAVKQVISNSDMTINGVPAEPELRNAVVSALTTVFNRTGGGFTLVGGAASAAGLVLMVLGFMSPRRDDEDDGRKVVVVG